jgi:hypothetical protein
MKKWFFKAQKVAVIEEINKLNYSKNLRGKIILKQKRTIFDLNEENDNFAIDIETIKSSHYKEVSELLARIKELEKAAKETDEQKGHGLLIEYGGVDKVPKVDKFYIGEHSYSKFIENGKRKFLVPNDFILFDHLFLIETNLATPTNRRSLVAVLEVHKRDGSRYMTVSDPINSF